MEPAAATMLPDPLRVLIVDDEPLFIEMVRTLLEAEGLEVVATAPDGLRAVELAASLDPDVVVMDVSMPLMDGIDATRAIRDDNPAASILILTGGSNITEIDRARKAGASGFLTKDRIASDLVTEIRRVAGR